VTTKQFDLFMDPPGQSVWVHNLKLQRYETAVGIDVYAYSTVKNRKGFYEGYKNGKRIGLFSSQSQAMKVLDGYTLKMRERNAKQQQEKTGAPF
jgi:hypothetical protein